MKNSYNINDTIISYRNNTATSLTGINHLRFKYPHYGMFHRILNMLRQEGFTVEKDMDIDKCIRRDYYVGRHGDLELYAHRYPNGFDIMFFQNIVFENQYGGRHDFDKFQKMPYLIRLQFIKYSGRIVSLMKSLEDLENKTIKKPRLAEDQIKADYAGSCHHEQKDMNFCLSDLDGQTAEPYNSRDRDGKMLCNGDMKYFRYYDGYLYRGRVYHNINNMWWVITDRFTIKNIASFRLFDLTPQDSRKRQAKPEIPKEYEERRKTIGNTKTKELINELRRRGIIVKQQDRKNR